MALPVFRNSLGVLRLDDGDVNYFDIALRKPSKSLIVKIIAPFRDFLTSLYFESLQSAFDSFFELNTH
jgi:hypothetical protein